MATQNMDEKTLNRLKVCLEKISSSPEGDNKLLKYTPADVDFHSLLLEASKNKMLHNMMGTVNAHLQMIRLRTVVLPGRAQKTVEEGYASRVLAKPFSFDDLLDAIKRSLGAAPPPP